jgi:hypothetical protein
MGSFGDLAHPFFHDEINFENFEKVLKNLIEGVKIENRVTRVFFV